MLTRRDFGKGVLAALPAASLLAKPNSNFGGVQIGAITYSFRALPSSAQEVLKYCVDLGISSIELMSDPAEAYAGAPQVPSRGRGPLSAEQQEAIRKATEARTAWRLALPMDKYQGLRKMYNDAGVKIHGFKLPFTPLMGEDEFEYIARSARALGANNVTMELPADNAFSKRVGDFAAKHELYIGYHNHAQVNETSWDVALSQSKYNTINLDLGHFTEAISGSPIPFIQKHHDRISSMHLKDKKYKTNGGENEVWGKGQTPIREVLQLMKKEKYKWPANIELEYDIPAGSDVIAEMRKCIGFCKGALA